MELAEMLATKPQDYLKDGFFEASGDFREGVNGEYSLGMAYRCRDEGVSPDTIQQIVKRLESIVENQSTLIDEEPEKALDASSADAFQQLSQSDEVTGSAVLNELFQTSGSLVTNWKNFAGLTIHLERIMAQLAMMLHLPKEVPEEE